MPDPRTLLNKYRYESLWTLTVVPMGLGFPQLDGDVYYYVRKSPD
jgi:hypothetical protein